ncbi:hypothetical protein D3C71_2103290 [compost metagenome]
MLRISEGRREKSWGEAPVGSSTLGSLTPSVMAAAIKPRGLMVVSTSRARTGRLTASRAVISVRIRIEVSSGSECVII